MSTSIVNSNLFLRACIGALPGRMKRMVFLTSLAAFVQNETVPDPAFMNKLNQALGLATSTDSALKFPIAISEVIWNQKEVIKADIDTLRSHPSTDSKAIAAAERIAKAVPTWLTGINESAVVQDLLTLFAGATSPLTPQRH